MKKFLIGMLLAASGLAQADDLTVSGFTTITAGKAYSGTDADFGIFKCPCVIGNYEHGQVYEGRSLSLRKESLAGLQLAYKFNDQFSATAQVVGRASDNMKPEMDWAYLTYEINDATTVQVGRRRLPIYAFSDSVYIGYSLPWNRVPQDIYGWEVGAYNGANVTHRATVGNVTVTGNLFAGQEVSKKNKEMERIYYGGSRVDDSWKHILGAYLDLATDQFSARLIYMQNSIDLTVFNPGEAPSSVFGTRQRIMGFSATADIDNFMFRMEANRFHRPVQDYKSASWTTTFGYKFGDFTPMLGYSNYTERLTDKYTATQIDNTRFVGVRWDFRKNMDLKLQWDSVKDSSNYQFSGNGKLLSVTLDAIF